MSNKPEVAPRGGAGNGDIKHSRSHGNSFKIDELERERQELLVKVISLEQDNEALQERVMDYERAPRTIPVTAGNDVRILQDKLSLMEKSELEIVMQNTNLEREVAKLSAMKQELNDELLVMKSNNDILKAELSRVTEDHEKLLKRSKNAGLDSSPSSSQADSSENVMETLRTRISQLEHELRIKCSEVEHIHSLMNDDEIVENIEELVHELEDLRSQNAELIAKISRMEENSGEVSSEMRCLQLEHENEELQFQILHLQHSEKKLNEKLKHAISTIDDLEMSETQLRDDVDAYTRDQGSIHRQLQDSKIINDELREQISDRDLIEQALNDKILFLEKCADSHLQRIQELESSESLLKQRLEIHDEMQEDIDLALSLKDKLHDIKLENEKLQEKVQELEENEETMKENWIAVAEESATQQQLLEERVRMLELLNQDLKKSLKKYGPEEGLFRHPSAPSLLAEMSRQRSAIRFSLPPTCDDDDEELHAKIRELEDQLQLLTEEKNAQIETLQHKVEDMRVNEVKLSETVTEMEQEERQLRERLHRLEASESAVTVNRYEKKIRALQSSEKDLLARMDSLENHEDDLREKLAYSDKKYETLRDKTEKIITEYQESEEHLNQQIQTLKDELKSKTGVYPSLDEAPVKKESKKTLSRLKDSIKGNKSKTDGVSAKTKTTHNEMDNRGKEDSNVLLTESLYKADVKKLESSLNQQISLAQQYKNRATVLQSELEESVKLCNELKRNLLSEQTEAAKLNEEVQECYTELDKFADLESDLRVEMSEIQLENEKLNIDNSQLNAEISAHKSKLANKENDLKQFQKQIDDYVNKMAAMESSLSNSHSHESKDKQLNFELKTSRETIEELEQQIHEFNEKNNLQQMTINDLAAQSASLQSRVDRSSQEIDRLERSNSKYINDIETLERSVNDYVKLVESLENDAEYHVDTIEQQQAVIAELEKHEKELMEKDSVNKDKIEMLQYELSGIRSKLDETHEVSLKYSEIIQSLQLENMDLSTKLINICKESEHADDTQRDYLHSSTSLEQVTFLMESDKKLREKLDLLIESEGKLLEKNNILEEMNEQLRNDLKKISDSYENSQQQVSDAEIVDNSLQEKLTDDDKDDTSMSRKISLLEESERKLMDRVMELEDELNGLQQTNSQLCTSNDNFAKVISQKEDQILSCKNELKKFEELDMARSEELYSLNKIIEKLRSELDSVKMEAHVNYAENLVRNDAADLKSSSSNFTHLDSSSDIEDIKVLKGKIDVLENEKVEYLDCISSLTDHLDHLSSSLDVNCIALINNIKGIYALRDILYKSRIQYLESILKCSNNNQNFSITDEQRPHNISSEFEIREALYINTINNLKNSFTHFTVNCKANEAIELEDDDAQEPSEDEYQLLEIRLKSLSKYLMSFRNAISMLLDEDSGDKLDEQTQSVDEQINDLDKCEKSLKSFVEHSKRFDVSVYDDNLSENERSHESLNVYKLLYFGLKEQLSNKFPDEDLDILHKATRLKAREKVLTKNIAELKEKEREINQKLEIYGNRDKSDVVKFPTIDLEKEELKVTVEQLKRKEKELTNQLAQYSKDSQTSTLDKIAALESSERLLQKKIIEMEKSRDSEVDKSSYNKPTDVLQSQIVEMQKLERHLNDQITELEHDRDNLHEITRKDKNNIHELNVRLRETELNEKNLKDQVNRFEVSERLLYAKNDNLEQEVHSLQLNVKELEIHRVKLQEALTKHQKDKEMQHIKYGTMEKAIDELTKSELSLKKRCNDLQTEKSFSTEDSRKLKETATELQRDKLDLEKQNNSLKQRNDNLEKKIGDLEKSSTALNKSIVVQSSNADLLREKVNTAHEENAGLIHTNSKQKLVIENLEKQISQMKETEEHLQRDVKVLDKNEKDLQKKLLEHQMKEVELQGALRNAEQADVLHKDRINSLQRIEMRLKSRIQEMESTPQLDQDSKVNEDAYRSTITQLQEDNGKLKVHIESLLTESTNQIEFMQNEVEKFESNQQELELLRVDNKNLTERVQHLESQILKSTTAPSVETSSSNQMPPMVPNRVKKLQSRMSFPKNFSEADGASFSPVNVARTKLFSKSLGNLSATPKVAWEEKHWMNIESKPSISDLRSIDNNDKWLTFERPKLSRKKPQVDEIGVELAFSSESASRSSTPDSIVMKRLSQFRRDPSLAATPPLPTSDIPSLSTSYNAHRRYSKENDMIDAVLFRGKNNFMNKDTSPAGESPAENNIYSDKPIKPTSTDILSLKELVKERDQQIVVKDGFINKLERQVQDIKHECKATEQMRINALNSIHSLEKEVDQLKEINAHLKPFKEKYNSLVVKVQNLESENKQLIERVQELSSMTAEIEKLQSQLKDYSKLKLQMSRMNEDMLAKDADLQSQMSLTDSLKKDNEALNIKLNDYERLKKQLEQLEIKHENLKVRIDELESEKQALVNSVMPVEKQFQKLKDKCEEKDKVIERLEKRSKTGHSREVTSSQTFLKRWSSREDNRDDDDELKPQRSEFKLNLSNSHPTSCDTHSTSSLERLVASRGHHTRLHSPVNMVSQQPGVKMPSDQEHKRRQPLNAEEDGRRKLKANDEFKVIMSYDPRVYYGSHRTNILTLTEGEQGTILSEIDKDGFYEGRVDGRRGLVPANYVQLLQPRSQVRSATQRRLDKLQNRDLRLDSSPEEILQMKEELNDASLAVTRKHQMKLKSAGSSSQGTAETSQSQSISGSQPKPRETSQLKSTSSSSLKPLETNQTVKPLNRLPGRPKLNNSSLKNTEKFEDTVLSPNNFSILRTVGDSGIMLGWSPPLIDDFGRCNGCEVKGYQILCNGYICDTPSSPHISKSLIEHLDLQRDHDFSIRTLCVDGSYSERVNIRYNCADYQVHGDQSDASLSSILASEHYDERYKRLFLGLYDYSPDVHSPNDYTRYELAFQTGDLITIYGEVRSDGFFHGEMNGKRGLVPESFIQELPRSSLVKSATIGSSQSNQSSRSNLSDQRR